MSMRSYKEAALKARRLMAKDGDSESMRLAVGEAIATAPTEEDRMFWKAVSDKLAAGHSLRTKELER
jgi:hypothetical protein